MVGDIAHVFNRGVEKRKIFQDEKDYKRFVLNLLCLNNKKGKIRVQHKDAFLFMSEIAEKREELVDVFCWSLMPNHYHLILHEKVDGGILEFTKRIGNAYTKYFNIKQKGRSGYLFQNSAHAVYITENSQLLYIPIYVHLNPADIYKSHWKFHNIDPRKIMDFVSNYRWSSLKNYNGHPEFEEIINKDAFYNLFDSNFNDQMKDLFEFIKDPIGIDPYQSTWQVD